jgi:putative tryptophan/tyrosine transport system substrate-binding protein
MLIVNTGTEGDLATAFASLAKQHVGALLIGSDALFWATRDQVISLAARYAIPTLYLESKAVTSGGLSSYGPDLVVSPARRLHRPRPSRRKAGGSARDPADQVRACGQMRTAKTLGLEIPPAVLAIADDVIE